MTDNKQLPPDFAFLLEKKKYFELFYRDQDGQLSDIEKEDFAKFTERLRKENPPKLGGFLVHAIESCESADLDHEYTAFNTRDEAENYAKAYRSKEKEFVQVVGVYGKQEVGFSAAVYPVTQAAMDEIKKQVFFFGAPISCTIDGETAFCTEYEDGLAIDTKEAAAPQFGKNAQASGLGELPLEILKSGNGFYIGTRDAVNGDPISRESFQYWHQKANAEKALKGGQWKQLPLGSSGFDFGDAAQKAKPKAPRMGM